MNPSPHTTPSPIASSDPGTATHAGSDPRPRAAHARARRTTLAIALIAVAALVSACSGGATSPMPTLSLEPTPTEAALPPCPTAEPAPLPAGETRTVTIGTKLGEIVITVDGSLSPIAAGNFVALAECGYYTNVVFHRVVSGFVIQGGDGVYGRSPNVDMGQVGRGGPGYYITDEPVTATYERGTVAMARTSAPNSQGSQFFIVQTDDARDALATYNTYAIFGTVKTGMEVVDLVVGAADAEIPTHPVVMDTVTVTKP